MSSQLHYFLAREQQADLARRAEHIRPSRGGEPSESAPRRRRLRARDARRRLGRGRLKQRELPLAPGGVERVPVSAGCLEVE